MKPDIVSHWTKLIQTPLGERLSRHTMENPEDAAIELFQHVANTVPAYREFLKERNVDPAAVQILGDFRNLPVTTKENYHQKYPLADLCRDGSLQSCDFIAVSSGSTGQPTFWPRFQTDEMEITLRFEQVFHDSFHADELTTLAVVCFALGTWVGGMYTTACCRYLTSKGYPVTVVTPGNNKDEILRVVKELGGQFDQLVLLGYPPFLKDVIDSGLRSGLDWKPYKIKLVMAGEVISEEWRDLMADRLGQEDLIHGSASIYGTADAGVLGNETPLSIIIRRFLAHNPQAARQLFGESRLPTLVQYDPLSRFFEMHDGRLLITGDNGIPLIRYNIMDTGGVIPCSEMIKLLVGFGFDPREELLAKNSRGVCDMPFVYVFGRSHFAVSFFGANIYPENISVGLEQRGIREWVTGKFVLEVKEDTDLNKYLSVAVELAPGEEPTEHRSKAAAISIRTQLERLNSEFANYAPSEFRTPHVSLRPAGDPEWFPVGVKHRYTRN
jgi:phenylacetate-CoA ligase